MHRLRESDIFMWYWLNFTKFGQRIICKTEEVISANFGTFHCNFPSKIDIQYLVTLNKVLFWSRDIENIILWKNVNRVTRSITTFKHSIVIYQTSHTKQDYWYWWIGSSCFFISWILVKDAFCMNLFLLTY